MSSGTPRESALIEQNKKRRIRELTPDETPDRSNGNKPQFIIITGQPGTGKTTLQERVVADLGASTATYDGDDNAKIHPRYSKIMRDNGLQGHAAVERRLPVDLHEELIGHLRGDAGGPKYDVVASHPLGRREQADYWLNGFRDRGYETTAVFVATHESNSMLGIAHRYQNDRDDPTKRCGRWVEIPVHDSLYPSNPRTAHELESTGEIDHIYVTDRDGRILYENHRTPDGSMRNDLGAQEAIIKERSRTPTLQEIERFNATVTYMHSTNPEVRPELLAEKVSMLVDYAVEEHRGLRQKGTPTAEPTAPGPHKMIDTKLQEQLREKNFVDKENKSERGDS